jgi:hypothetical protein
VAVPQSAFLRLRHKYVKYKSLYFPDCFGKKRCIQSSGSELLLFRGLVHNYYYKKDGKQEQRNNQGIILLLQKV